MFDPNTDETRFDVMRVDRATGKKQMVRDVGTIAGRWPAEAELKKLREQNRDPNVVFELQQSGMNKTFRASAFGDQTNKFAKWEEPEE
jgi:hypothetical protein